ncbi:hypothetical protein CA267_015570 [Alteromonas pelagimontana]|uniref:Uncharacterized protein n=1 Tax=Alteromonas pelagimontana TaxID=1858656 RepID=A0A6M4MGQ4_9ALTE|nr:hypothetical protein [Alteromonas pelagimontana]QJR82068.1 hypothetical protein CA267_015570 [Alteromonas pelagimontana]
MNLATAIVCVGIILTTCSAELLAADRSNALSSGYDRKPAKEGDLPVGWQKNLLKGQFLDYDVYRMGQLVYREPSAGIVSIRIENKVIRLVENTREIVSVLDTL